MEDRGAPLSRPLPERSVVLVESRTWISRLTRWTLAKAPRSPWELHERQDETPALRAFYNEVQNEPPPGPEK